LRIVYQIAVAGDRLLIRSRYGKAGSSKQEAGGRRQKGGSRRQEAVSSKQ
jgi:hypothetical protein